MAILRPKTYKTKKGSVEVYGGLNDDLFYHPPSRANEIGIYVTRKSPDCSEHHIDEGASVHLTPKMARQVGERLVQWAEQMEGKNNEAN